MLSSTRFTRHPYDSFRCPQTGVQVIFDAERHTAEQALSKHLAELRGEDPRRPLRGEG